MAQKRYEIFITDDNGWLDGCPDSEGVFFGDAAKGGTFTHDSRGGILTIEGCRKAHQVLRELRASGDWIAPEEVNSEGLESRPVYGIREARIA
jgi:hypothetical protein